MLASCSAQLAWPARCRSARRRTRVTCASGGESARLLSRRELALGGALLSTVAAPRSTLAAEDAAPGAGRLALVTGANTGIGFETARGLAARGYTVMLACRSLDKANATAATLRAESPTAQFLVLDEPLELSDLRSVDSFAQSVRRTGKPLSLLINNAGIMAAPLGATAQGHECHFGVNHLGHYALTLALLEPLRAAPTAARVVNVSSIAAYGDSLVLDDLDWKKRDYGPWNAYFASKLSNVLFTNELASREPGLVVHAVHPGVVDTELARYILPPDVLEKRRADPGKSAALARLLGLRSPVQGAVASLWVATDAAAGACTGKFWLDAAQEAPAFARPGGGEAGRRRAAELWARSEEFLTDARRGRVV